MATSSEIKQRANALAEKTDVNSITPREVGGIMYDLASHGENVLRNGGTLGIRKVYESVAAMEADSTNPKDFWGDPIKKGNLVVIYDGTTTGVDNNKIYAFMKPGWQFATYLDAAYVTKSDFSMLVGVTDKDITDSITWTNGLWSFSLNTGAGSTYHKQTYRYSNKIDISDFDEIKLSGLWNGSSTSTPDSRYPTITFFGDGNQIEWKDYQDGESFTIFRSDYAEYDKLEIVVNAYQSEENYVPSVKITKKGILNGNSSLVAKRIVMCGDSLTGNESSLLAYQLRNIAKSQGYEIIRNSMGGENIIGNLTRNGGIGVRITSDFVMPSSGSVDISVESAWMKADGTYAQNPYNNISNRDARIMGVKGKLTRNSTTSYTFTRDEEGESFKVGIGTIFWDEALWSCRGYTHIWFTGQNGGYDTDEEWAEMINMAARNFGENFVVCSTALSRTTNELIRYATKIFGDKYINLRAYTEGQAVYDGQRFGLIDTSKSASDYAELFWPGSDKVHQNNLLSYMWAVLIWNTLIDLGYIEGTRVETGVFFKE